MAMSLQVANPTGEGKTFDYDYYLGTHMPIVVKHMGPHISQTVLSKGPAGGPDTPPGFFVIVTMICADQAALDATLGVAGPAVKDIANFYNGAPQMLIGEVIG